MTPEQHAERAALYTRAHALIERLKDGERDDAARDALLLDLTRYQARYVPPFASFLSQRARGRALDAIEHVPALPTDAFRFARISSREPGEEVRTFVSSGTTQDTRSTHALTDLSLYDLAARQAARYALFPDLERMQLIILAPREDELRESSLSYMLARFVEWFGTGESRYVWPIDAAQTSALVTLLEQAERSSTPVALLGTSFAFVHALDALLSTRFALPARSRIMQTGGFKGRSREVEPVEMRALLTRTFGIPDPFIVAEYGMTELSSQLYETTLRAALLGDFTAERRLWAPGWVRAVPIDPETLAPQAHGVPGLVRIDDLANLDSVACIQTSDVGVVDEHGLCLLGRAKGAVARGCSITADELLRKERP